MVGPDGRARAIESITLDDAPTAVFGLEVGGTHTYFADGTWVHNNSCPLRGLAREHHLLPIQFADKFRARGLEPNEFTLWLDGDFHQVIHGKGGTIAGSWNGAWHDFFRRKPDATRDEILLEYSLILKRFMLD